MLAYTILGSLHYLSVVRNYVVHFQLISEIKITILKFRIWVYSSLLKGFIELCYLMDVATIMPPGSCIEI